MEISIFTIEVAVFMVAVSIALVVWFQYTKTVLSTRRMARMMTRLGLAGGGMLRNKDPEIRSIMKQSRARCAKCPHEDHCERWLAGEIGGGTSFCPNSRTFMDLK
jgi:hypothetical protein